MTVSVDLRGLVAGRGEEVVLAGRADHVLETHRDARLGGVFVAEGLEVVEDDDRAVVADVAVAGEDCLGIADKLAPISRQIYKQVREICPVFVEDTPFYEDIRNVEKFLMENPLSLF